MAFRRKRDEQVDISVVDDDSAVGDVTASADATASLTARPHGPRDVDEVDDEQLAQMLDFGALLISGRDGMEIQAQVDEATGQVTTVTAVLGEAAIQLQAFAAPRTDGLWSEVREALRSGIASGGGLVDEVAGEFGPELRARVPDGAGGLQPVRFAGIDGPRWFLRAVFLGGAVDPAGATGVSEVLKSVVVRRGREAMAPGDPIPMTLPGAEGATPAEVIDLNPFERGPEITEIR